MNIFIFIPLFFQGLGYNMPMILLIGASASGKTEIAKLLREKFGIVKAITHTSRQPRIGERNGVDYFFVDDPTFLKLLAEGAFVEHTFYNGHYYGCSKKEVADNKCVVVDPNGLRSFLALKDQSVVTFLLEASEKTRRERMAHRGDKPEDIEKRIQNDRADFSKAHLAPTDYHIKTDGRNLEELAQDIYGKYLSTLKSRGLNSVLFR
jgi:guanylate kinase